MRNIHSRFASIFLCLALCMCVQLCAAQTQPTSVVQTTPQRDEVKIGAYLTSLYNINQSRGTFSADLWIWALSNPKTNYKIEEALEINYISNEFPRTFSGYYTEPVTPGVKIEQRKIQGVFLHDFDMENFPFDKQRLKISFEDSSNDLTKMVYTADTQSGYDPAISIDGWIIQNLTATQEVKEYNSNFGVFTKPDHVQYSRIVVTAELMRDSSAIFLKLTLGLLIAVLVALCSCLMPTHSEDIFSGRMGLLGGALIAAVVNQQFADASQGNTTTVTLVDKLHMLGMFVMITLLGATSQSRRLYELHSDGTASKRFDLQALSACSALFFGVSMALVALAIHKAHNA